MKKLLGHLLISVLLLTSLAWTVEITTWKDNYESGTNHVWMKVHNKPGNEKDWIGIYPVNANNSWNNVVSWTWARDITPANDPGDWYQFVNLVDGNYEARFFLNNTYVVEDSIPFSVGDVVRISTSKESYNVDEAVGVTVTHISGNDDWVGIYPKGSSNAWANVKTWKWAEQDGQINIAGVEAGEYEARLFFNNNFDVKSKVAFTVSADVESTLSTSKETYNENDTVNVTVSNLSGVKDWVGIYPKNANNSWANVIKWNWVTGDGSFDLSRGDKDMPAGEYEARLFFDNSYSLEKSVGFSVSDGNDYVYGSEGAYINEVEYDNTHADYFVYYPRNHIVNAPLVLVSGYSDVRKYKGLMKYLASQGCYVVGHATRNGEGWSSSSWRINYFKAAVEHAHQLGVDTSRLITMGSSAGGMVSYPVMKYFKAQGYGATKSFIIDIIGYYAASMTKNDLNNLESDSLMLYIGTDNGTQDGGFDEDSRTLLTLSKLLNSNMKKSFISLGVTNHGYASGSYENVITKKALLEPIDAMLKYEFFNNNGQYNNAESILFDNYAETVQRIYDATMVRVGNKEPLKIGYDFPCVNKWDENGQLFDPEMNPYGRHFTATIDYCNDHGLQ